MSIIDKLGAEERDLLERLHICHAARLHCLRNFSDEGPTDTRLKRFNAHFRRIWRSLWEHARDRGLVGEEANPSNWTTKEALA